MKIGPVQLRNRLIVAPMAGVTDRPFRILCKKLGAGMAVSEMVASNSLLWGSEKTIRRGNHEGEVEPRVVQIAGADPEMMAEAAKYNADKGRHVLEYTGADAIMIGRAAQGRPWIFREIDHYLQTGTKLDPPSVAEIRDVLVGHLHDLYAFYGYERGTRVARKHISWYTKGLKNSAVFRARMNTIETAELQLAAVAAFFDELHAHSARLQYEPEEVAIAA